MIQDCHNDILRMNFAFPAPVPLRGAAFCWTPYFAFTGEVGRTGGRNVLLHVYSRAMRLEDPASYNIDF